MIYILVKHKNGVEHTTLSTLHQSINSTILKDYPQLNLQLIETENENALELYINNDIIEYAEEDQKVTLITTPDDQYIPYQWAINSIKLDVPWQNEILGDPNVIVAVIDTGVDYTHPDLSPNCITGYNVLTGSTDPMDDNGHGTHCAGIIGAIQNNQIGISGVAPNITILPIKAMGADGTGYASDILSGILYADSYNADIISLSLCTATNVQSLKDAIDASPAVVVCAAGNDNINIDLTPYYPAAFTSPNIISVGSHTSSNIKAVTSNFGSYSVDIFAPGDGIISTSLNNEYIYMSGTSMAAPFVSGVAALIKSIYPTFTNTQIISYILENTSIISSLNGLCTSNGKLSTSNMFQIYNKIVQFTDTSTGSPNEWLWDFGDNTYSYEQNPQHTYLSDGSYNVTLYTSNQYQQNTTSMYIIVKTLTMPVAYFYPSSYNVVTSTLPIIINFQNLSKTSYYTTYLWDFGDGTTSTSKNPSHSFASYGSYDIKLTVSNTMGTSIKIYPNAINIAYKSITLNEVINNTDSVNKFECQVFIEYATGTDLPIVYANIFNEVTQFIQREIPDTPGIDDHGMRNFYSTINEWGHRIISGVTVWGHRILHPASSVDHTPIRCFDAQTFREDVIVADEWQFGTE